MYIIAFEKGISFLTFKRIVIQHTLLEGERWFTKIVNTPKILVDLFAELGNKMVVLFERYEPRIDTSKF